MLGEENPNVILIRNAFSKFALLFYTIQNKSEKNIYAMIMHTCKSKLNLFFLEPYLQLL
jgi:hypothetical protein